VHQQQPPQQLSQSTNRGFHFLRMQTEASMRNSCMENIPHQTS